MTRNVFGLGISRPLFGELVVGGVLDGHEVVPCRQVTDQRLGVHTAQLFFTHRESHHRHVFGLQARVAQFFVERYVGVAVDGGNHSRLTACREFLHIGHDGLVIGVTKRGVFFVDVFVSHAFAFQVSTQDFVGGAGVHVVGAQQDPTLGAAAFFAHQVIHSRNRLLVGRSAGVEHVFGELFTFVLHGIEQQAVHFFDDRQHRFA